MHPDNFMQSSMIDVQERRPAAGQESAIDNTRRKSKVYRGLSLRRASRVPPRGIVSPAS
jgi:hypothetical protein